MKAQLTGVLAISLLSFSVAEGQTASEQLQRAIYTQSMIGDFDAAIRLYQQVIAATPAGSEVRTQAERLLANAQTYRDIVGPQGMGGLVSSTYLHRHTGISFDVPWFWKIQGTHPSTDAGEQVDFIIPYPNDPLKRPARAFVWMAKFPAEIDDAEIERLLESAAADLTRQREREGLDNWRLREENGRQSGRNPYVEELHKTAALSALADYREDGRAMIEYFHWVLGHKTRALFSIRMAAEDFNDGVIVSKIQAARSAKVP